MELHQIKSFVTVARTGNLTRAADRLNTTPPSVSAHIRQLEEAYNIRLFNRTPRGMTLTESGKELVRKAEEILDRADAFIMAAHRTGGRICASLRMGINSGPEFLRIQSIVHCLFQHHPGLNLEVAALNTGEILKQTGGGQIDLGYVFGRHRDDRLAFRPLSRVDLDIAVPARFKSSHGTAGWREIAALPWIRPASLCPFMDQVTALLAEKGLTLAQPIVANDDITKAAFINQGTAVTVLERSEARALEKENKVFIWKAGDPLSTELSLVYLKSGSNRPPLKIVADAVEKIWAEADEYAAISGQK